MHKQNVLVVNDAYIDIEGEDHNLISINMDTLTYYHAENKDGIYIGF